MTTESLDVQYVGYSAEELKAQLQAEYQANRDRLALARKWQRRAAEQAAAYSDAIAALQVLSAGWQAAALEPEPFLLTRQILRGKVAPKSGVRWRTNARPERPQTVRGLLTAILCLVG